MKIAMFSDKPGSAIHRLGEMIRTRLPHLEISHVTLHPKNPSEQEIKDAAEALRGADLVDAQYWKSGMTAIKIFGESVLKRKKILTHQNEHNINDDGKNHWEWQDIQWDAIVAKNGWQKQQLEQKGYKPVLIRHAIEFKNFEFIPELTKEKIVIYVGQIKKVKGVREIKQACDDLGYQLMIVGNPSEGGYWAEFSKDNLLYYSNVPDDKIGQIYHQARVFVCNSDDGTESGTMPILEAMLSGIPVITRKIGHIRDMGEHMKNMYIREGHYTDIEDLKSGLQLIMENEDIANSLRENAWRTVRQYHPEVQAREYEKLYWNVLYPAMPLVSVIMPTFNRADALTMQFEALANQTYKKFEVVICDDGSVDNTRKVVDEARKLYKYPIKYINTGETEKYGLAKARNMGIIESIGDILVFCDDRLKMSEDSVFQFVNKLQAQPDKRCWAWGSKGKFKQFVENFSAVWRRTFIDGGMFNERIDEYGGMTQEINNRFARQGIRFEWTPEALCEPIFTTHSKSKHRQAIINSKVKLFKLGFQ